MRVLHLARTLDESEGWGRYSARLLQALGECAVESALLLGHRPPSEASAPSSGQAKSLGGGSTLARTGADAVLWASLARQQELIHALDESTVPLAASLSRVSGRPWVATLHGTYAERLLTGRGGPARRRMLARARLLLPVSRYTRERVLQVAPELADRIEVVNLGVSEAPLPSSPLEARGPLLLSVGAVKRRKGVLELVQALGPVRARVPEARVVIAGPFTPGDPYVAEVRAAAQAQGVEPWVEFAGIVSQSRLEALYQQARVLVMPSQNNPEGFEGFGLVHLEAAARGLPSIGSLGCGNEDAVSDGETGFLVPQGDLSVLVERTVELLTDDELWRRLSRAARLSAGARSWGTVGARTREAYDRALARSRPPLP